MIKNYFTVAWRNLIRNKGYSAINIGGLAVGMAVAMLIGLWIYDELSFDKCHSNYDTVAQVMQSQTVNGEKGASESVPMPLIGELSNNYGSNFKHLAMASWQGDHILTFNDQKITMTGNYMDVAIPEMLSLKMLAGNYQALQDPHSIILSTTASKALFGNVNAIDKLIKIDNKQDVKVTGVYEDISASSSFKGLNFIAPWQLFFNDEPWVQNALKENQWSNNSFQLFAQIAGNTSFEAVNAKIINSKNAKVADDEKNFKTEIFLHPMKDWHLRSNWENGVQSGGFIEYVWMFGMVGIFVLLLACINFMNLSTARSEKRAREVGIRKAIGSARIQLIKQFFGESLLVVLVSFVGACLLVMMVLPWFNGVTEKAISFPFTQLIFWLLALVFILITALLAGSYPAFYLSSFNPVKVLKGSFVAGRFASLPRKVLVVIQFTVSIALIIGTLLVNRQVQHTKNRPLGYDSNAVVMVQMRSPDFYGKFDILRNELLNNGAITEMAESSSPLHQIWNNTSGFNWKGKDPNLDAEFSTIRVTHSFGKTVGWQFLQGRDFSREMGTDSAAMVLNESAVKYMNIEKPLETVVEYHGKNYNVVGVVKDMLIESPYEPVRQAVYLISYSRVNWFHIKLNPKQPGQKSLASIESVFKKYIPSAPFDYQFADDAFGKKFKAEERVSKLTNMFAVLAIFISCLGLFGLASFVAEQRKKEIGIRKISGASVFSLWKLLSKDFLLLVFIASLIAMPLAYYYLNGWLQHYQYRTNISWMLFVAAILMALVITLLTVSFQAIKAALANPVKSLRTE